MHKVSKESIAGVDIDLRRCHVWHEERGRLLYEGTEHDLVAIVECHPETTFLAECASPIIYGLTGAKLRNLLRWFIYNSYVVGKLSLYENVLFSPSSAWKHGWPEDEMMKILGITGDNHDIRQCRAMCRMYRMHPEDWRNLGDFMAKL